MLSNPLIIKVGSRASRLALVQVEEVQALLTARGVQVKLEHKTYTTRGDQDKTTSLTANAGDDFFTDALDEALLSGEIDVAIHSAKDLPQQMREGITVLALTQSPDETDAFVGKIPFDQLPAGARVATSSALRLEQVKRLKPDIQTLDIRGTIQERIQTMKDGYCDGIIVATVALKRLGLEHLIQDILPWEATPLQGQLAVTGRAGDARLRALLTPIDARAGYGRVILVGAGPGDPQLITVKGVRALASADCVFYDYLVSQKLLKHAPEAEKIYAGKRKGAHAMPQDELNRLLRQKAMQGKTVVRLKGGDPLIFGRGADEIEYLRQYHIHVEVIPGVSSATGIPSRLGIPLTAREVSSSVAFVSGYQQGEKDTKENLLDIPKAGTLVFLMGLTKLEQIVHSLETAGWSTQTPVMIISKGTCPEEKIVRGTLADIRQKVKDEPLEPPVLIIAGETLRFYRPAPAPRVLYTGSDPAQLRAAGEVVPFPMIEITPAKLTAGRIKTLLTNLVNYDIILFTSKFGVKYFFELLVKKGYAAKKISQKTFVAIGRATAKALAQEGVSATLVAKVETSEGLFQEMAGKLKLRSKKILFPRSALPNPFLKRNLTKQGAQVDELTVYDNTPPAKRPLPVPEAAIDQVVFTSPSTARNFLAAYGAIPRHWRILSRGAATSAFLREAGYTDFEELRSAH
ncbi:MAG: uroporphyrinogen-III C-methyltransferase [Candidatus Omnitrophica bacterium]|nr:uroporphyrinogen-III C-methyltransferase [Candidatus Omnitrophota bacterium]